VSRFTPKIQEINNKPKNNKTDKLASFAKLPPSILAKTSKEVKEILKFFIKSSQPMGKRDTTKLYVQASSVVATTHRNGTHSMLTSAKLSVGYLIVGITRELNKEPSLY